MGDKFRRTYNYYLLQLRINIEMTFGRLTTKWRIFRRNMEGDLESITNLLMAAAKLHNFVIDNDNIPLPSVHTPNYKNPTTWGVEPLNGNGAIANNNGYLAHDITDNEEHSLSAVRIQILESIVVNYLLRPNHNIDRN